MTSLSSIKCDTLVCIYTCDEHRGLLHKFHASALGQYLKGLADIRLIEVYADPEIDHSTLHKNELILKAQEKYEALSIKTYKMIKYCVQNIDFQYLLKIDVATVRDQFIGPQYEGRKPVDLGELINFLKTASFDEDYDGFTLFQNVPRANSENWAAKKGGAIDFKRVFGNSQYLPPFYRGLCYMVSRRFAQYISQNGQEMAEEHEKYFLGAEDVMVGRLHKRFQEVSQ